MTDINLIFQLTALAIIVSLLFTFLKQMERDEYAYLTVVAGLAVAVIRTLPVILEFFNQVRSVFQLY